MGDSRQSSVVSLARRIDLACDRFEQNWRMGRRQSLETYLVSVEATERDAYLRALLELELALRREQGEVPQRSEYLVRFMGDQTLVESLFESAEKQSPSNAGRPTVESQIDQTKTGQPKKKDGVRQVVPTEFGRYRIKHQIGAGGMGTVVLAEDTLLGRPVALKIPYLTGTDQKEQLERFDREARTAAMLRHPNICPVYDFGEVNGIRFISMAYIEGLPLHKYAAENPLDEHQIARLMLKLAGALQDAHENGVVHRDLKPANIMMDKKGEPIVMDFGLAMQMQLQADVRLTQTGMQMGSPAYMPPEQVDGDKERIGPPADIYSLGVVLYELLTGHVPFDGPTAMIFVQIIMKEPARPSDLRPGLSPHLEHICLRMMAKRIEHRFASMSAVADALANWLRDPAVMPCFDVPNSQPDEHPETPTFTERPNELDSPNQAEGTPSQASGDVSSLKPPVENRDWVSQARSQARTAAATSLKQVLKGKDPAFMVKGFTGQESPERPGISPITPEAELRMLMLDINNAIRDGKMDDVLLKVDRVLELQPDNPAMLRLQEKLQARRSIKPAKALSPSLIKRAWSSLILARQTMVAPIRQLLAKCAWLHTPLQLRSRWYFRPITQLVRRLRTERVPAGLLRATPLLDLLAVAVIVIFLIVVGWKLCQSGGTRDFKSRPTVPNPVPSPTPTSNRPMPPLSVPSEPTLHRHAIAFCQPGKIATHDFATGIQQALTVDEPRYLSWTPEGLYFISRLELRRLRAGNDLPQTVFTFPTIPRWVAVAPGGNRVAFEESVKHLRVMQLPMGELESIHKLATDPRWSADGKLLTFTIQGTTNWQIGIWESDTNVRVIETTNRFGYVYPALSPDLSRIAFGTGGSAIGVASFDGKYLGSLTSGGGNYLCPAYSPDGRYVACYAIENYSASPGRRLGKLVVIDTVTFVETTIAEGVDLETYPCWAPASGDRTVKEPDVTPQKATDEDPLPPTTKPPSLPSQPPVSRDTEAATPNARSTTTNEPLTLKGHTSSVTSVAFSPDGKRLASASQDQTIRLWDSKSGQETHTLKGHTGAVVSVAFRADGKRLASASHDTTAKIWDVTSGQETFTLEGDGRYINCVAFSRDGQRLASASDTVGLWEALFGTEFLSNKLTLKGHNGNVTSVAFSPDGKRLAVAGGGTGKVWNAKSGIVLLTLKVPVECVAFSPDGERLALTGADQTVNVIDSTSGAGLLTLRGHSGYVSSVVYSADGSRLASASHDRTVRVWDATSGQELLTLKGHTSAVTSVAFSPDGKRLASASSDQTVKVWDVTSENVVDANPISLITNAPSLQLQPPPPPSTTVAKSLEPLPLKTMASNLSFEGIRNGQERADNWLKMKLCWCAPGTYMKGSPKNESGRQDDEDHTEVTLAKGFWMGKYEVTQSEWRNLTSGRLGFVSFDQRGLRGTGDRHPMAALGSWEAIAYCRLLTEQERRAGRLPDDWEYQLPTEAQWEYACRAGTRTRFHFGYEEELLDGYAWFKANSDGKSRSVGSRKPNIWGFHDMHGNVREMCADNLFGRGGSWNTVASNCRAAARKSFANDMEGGADVGFRVVVVQSVGTSPQALPTQAGSNPTSLIERYRDQIKTTASSEWSGWPVSKLLDDDDKTYWFSALGHSAAYKKPPWFEVAFPESVTVTRVKVLGCREQKNLGVLEASLTLSDSKGTVLANVTAKAKETTCDLEFTFQPAVSGVFRVRFLSLEDEGDKNRTGNIALGEVQIE